jgi:ribosomal protein S18 acetylase RimI-like enzyme
VESHTPAHGLGPHVVGRRVVVRRLLPGRTGPSGGPALTDVLGTCTAWGDGVCVIAPDGRGDRTPVTIAIADIVSGKPVPPRTPPRQRVTPATAQRRALALWPDVETRPVGDWLLRHSVSSPARRANSVLAMGPSGVASDYDAVVAFYDALGQRPIAAVLPESSEDDLFRAHGWGLESHDADTVFEIAGVAEVSRRLPPSSVEMELTIDGDLATASVGNRAGGVVAVDGDWAGFRSIAVDPGHRRQGLGLAVMAALVEWSAERGATTAYLQVLGDNSAALALYDGLGFREHHRYRYLARPT